MRKRFPLLLLVVACQTSSSVSSGDDALDKSGSLTSTPLQWHSVRSGAALEPSIAVAAGEVTFTLSGYYTRSLQVAGAMYTEVTLPGSSPLAARGYPELPKVRFNLPVDDVADLEVVDEQHIDVAMDPPLPSRGVITRNQDPKSIPYTPGSFYVSNDVYPTTQAELGAPFTLRELNGVPVELHPFRYDAGTGTMRIYTKMRVRVAGVSVNKILPPASAFAPIYQSAFRFLESTTTDIREPGRMVILAPAQFADAVKPLRDWKIRRGIKTEIKVLDQSLNSAAKIKTFVAQEYAKTDPLTYLMLVGDADTMPTLKGGYEQADCDSCFAMVAGNDFYPDLFVSRISAKTVADVTTQVNKFITYERTPDASATWYNKAISIASNEGSPTDWQRAEELRTMLEADQFVVSKHYDPGATTAKLVEAINAGASLLNYIGHGAGTYWVTTNFGIDDFGAVKNGTARPYVLDVACQNGAFVDFDTSLAEAFLRNAGGAIGMYAASTNAAWVPPTVMQKWAVQTLTKEQHLSMGSLAFGGAAEVLAEYPDGDGQMLVEQYVLFGDASILLRTRAPHPFVVGHSATIGSAGTLDVSVDQAATVVLTNGDLIASAQTDGSGTVHLPYSGLSGSVNLTVTGRNAIPYEAQLTVVQ